MEKRPEAVGREEQYMSHKKRLPALLLCWFFFWLGAHRFYVGKWGTGILCILTFGGLGFWAILDTILIVAGVFRDKRGDRLVEWT